MIKFFKEIRRFLRYYYPFLSTYQYGDWDREYTAKYKIIRMIYGYKKHYKNLNK